MAIAPAVNEITKGFAKAEGLLLGDGVYLFTGAGTPSNGTSGTGAGWAGIGSMYVNVTAGTLFQNTGTKASPTWGART
jgi:hypothetical protein